MQIEIADSTGRSIKTLKGTTEAGVNRVWWDLKYDSTRQPRLRTSPEGHPEIGLQAEGWRPFPFEGRFAPLVPPGSYAVKLRAGRTELARQLVVKKDPSSLGSDDGIRAQTTLALDIWNNVNTISDLIEQIEGLRRQIADIKAALQSDARWKPHVAEAEALDGKLLAVERVFFDPRVTSAGDSFYYPPGLFQKLQGLARGIMEADFQPTGAQGEVAAMFMREVSAQKERLDAIVRSEVGTFNDRLKAANVPHVGLRPAKPPS